MSRMRYWLDALYIYAKDYVLENTGLKVLALLITAVLWLSVASRPVTEITLHNVPIEIRNLTESPDLIVSHFDTLAAQVSLRGPRDALDQIRSSDLIVVADMSGVEPGVRVIPLKVDMDNTRYRGNVEVRAIEPRSIRVTVERAVEREVPIKPRFDGEPAPGYEVTSWTISPSTTHIEGASSIVGAINEVSTETVGLSGRTASFSDSVAIDIGSPSVNISDRDRHKVQLTVNIAEVQKERTIEHIPVSINGGPLSARSSPLFVSVVLSGPRSAVDAITPADIVCTVDYPRGRARAAKPEVNLLKDQDRITVRSVSPKIVLVR